MTASKHVEGWAQLYAHSGEDKKNICRRWKQGQAIKEKDKNHGLDM